MLTPPSRALIRPLSLETINIRYNSWVSQRNLNQT
ncbi:hypothetical protein ANRL4_01127 [Anaerolineae bacterium]|nr:hypothetical protein ANRL4_01127 [Anaerolineae bacterium]